MQTYMVTSYKVALLGTHCGRGPLGRFGYFAYYSNYLLYLGIETDALFSIFLVEGEIARF